MSKIFHKEISYKDCSREAVFGGKDNYTRMMAKTTEHAVITPLFCLKTHA
ncbi:MAG: hypothetical protein ACJ0P6_00190 [Flavobacteriaceae bacterium]